MVIVIYIFSIQVYITKLTYRAYRIYTDRIYIYINFCITLGVHKNVYENINKIKKKNDTLQTHSDERRMFEVKADFHLLLSILNTASCSGQNI